MLLNTTFQDTEEQILLWPRSPVELSNAASKSELSTWRSRESLFASCIARCGHVTKFCQKFCVAKLGVSPMCLAHFLLYALFFHPVWNVNSALLDYEQKARFSWTESLGPLWLQEQSCQTNCWERNGFPSFLNHCFSCCHCLFGQAHLKQNLSDFVEETRPRYDFDQDIGDVHSSSPRARIIWESISME